jgi:hypothetical protein
MYVLLQLYILGSVAIQILNAYSAAHITVILDLQNSPVLRRRLMNKELDPPVLLTMSPDELKV